MSVPRNAQGSTTLEHRGCRLAYTVAGEGPPVLLVQGTGIHGDGWIPQIEDLSTDHRCAWFDNRGMGRSQPLGDGPITVGQMAEDAGALLDGLGWDSAHVVGHSLGGVIAQELALSAPERVRSLSLLCTSSSGPGLVRMSASMLWRGIRMEVGSLRSRRNAFLEIVLSPDELSAADPDAVARDLEPLFGRDLAVRAPVTMKQVGSMRRWDRTERLGELGSIPTLVVSARHDPIAPPALVRALAEGIPGARLVELEHSAHGVTITRADRINELLREHLRAAEQARAA